MADPNLSNQLAKPVHIQRLERSLRLEPFLDQVQDILRRYAGVSFLMLPHLGLNGSCFAEMTRFHLIPLKFL